MFQPKSQVLSRADQPSQTVYIVSPEPVAEEYDEFLDRCALGDPCRCYGHGDQSAQYSIGGPDRFPRLKTHNEKPGFALEGVHVVGVNISNLPRLARSGV